MYLRFLCINFLCVYVSTVVYFDQCSGTTPFSIFLAHFARFGTNMMKNEPKLCVSCLIFKGWLPYKRWSSTSESWWKLVFRYRKSWQTGGNMSSDTKRSEHMFSPVFWQFFCQPAYRNDTIFCHFCIKTCKNMQKTWKKEILASDSTWKLVEIYNSPHCTLLINWFWCC